MNIHYPREAALQGARRKKRFSTHILPFSFADSFQPFLGYTSAGPTRLSGVRVLRVSRVIDDDVRVAINSFLQPGSSNVHLSRGYPRRSCCRMSFIFVLLD